MSKPAPLTKLQALTFKRISVIEIDPNRYISRFSGGSESGKTSLLDAIEWGLAGESEAQQ